MTLRIHNLSRVAILRELSGVGLGSTWSHNVTSVHVIGSNITWHCNILAFPQSLWFCCRDLGGLLQHCIKVWHYFWLHDNDTPPLSPGGWKHPTLLGSPLTFPILTWPWDLYQAWIFDSLLSEVGCATTRDGFFFCKGCLIYGMPNLWYFRCCQVNTCVFLGFYPSWFNCRVFFLHADF